MRAPTPIIEIPPPRKNPLWKPPTFLWCTKRNNGNFAQIWRAICDKFAQRPSRERPLLGILVSCTKLYCGTACSVSWTRGLCRKRCDVKLSPAWTESASEALSEVFPQLSFCNPGKELKTLFSPGIRKKYEIPHPGSGPEKNKIREGLFGTFLLFLNCVYFFVFPGFRGFELFARIAESQVYKFRSKHTRGKTQPQSLSVPLISAMWGVASLGLGDVLSTNSCQFRCFALICSSLQPLSLIVHFFLRISSVLFWSVWIRFDLFWSPLIEQVKREAAVPIRRPQIAKEEIQLTPAVKCAASSPSSCGRSACHIAEPLHCCLGNELRHICQQCSRDLRSREGTQHCRAPCVLGFPVLQVLLSKMPEDIPWLLDWTQTPSWPCA